jgi:pimeloyl-ACP methyl ester carboxylesterase
MERITSKDGTTIAFEQFGNGPPIIVVSGASTDRSNNARIAAALAEHSTVLNHDRRGRGDSSDTLPYAVEREVEDLQALVEAAGGSAGVLGLSSGAVLAAEAAASGLSIDRLFLWEPPFSLDPDGPRRAKAYADGLGELLAAGRRGDALEHFMRMVGIPDQMIAGMRSSPYWQAGERLAPTLAYDAAVMGDNTIPTERFARITVPTLVLAGSESPRFLQDAAAHAAASIPGACHDVLAGQDHDVDARVIAQAVADFAQLTRRVS